MSYFVYIIRSLKDRKFYTGITDDLMRRLKQHNIGSKATRSTINRGPFKLVHVEECEDRKVARRLERFWKSGAGRELRDGIFK